MTKSLDTLKDLDTFKDKDGNLVFEDCKPQITDAPLSDAPEPIVETDITKAVKSFIDIKKNNKKGIKYRKKAMLIMDNLDLSEDDIFVFTHLPIDDKDLYKLAIDMRDSRVEDADVDTDID